MHAEHLSRLILCFLSTHRALYSSYLFRVGVCEITNQKSNRGWEKLAIREDAKRENAKTVEETVVRFRNIERRKVDEKIVTSAKQSCVGDYSCCGQVP